MCGGGEGKPTQYGGPQDQCQGQGGECQAKYSMAIILILAKLTIAQSNTSLYINLHYLLIHQFLSKKILIKFSVIYNSISKTPVIM